MKDRFKDLALLIQRDRKAQTILGLIVIAILYVSVADNSPHHRPPPREENTTTNTTLAANEQYDDLMNRVASEIETLHTTARQQGTEIQQLKESMDKNVEQTAEIFRKILERVNDQNAPKQVASQMPAGAESPDMYGSGARDLSGNEVTSFGLEPTNLAVPPTPAPRHIAFVGAGDSVRVKLLAGVNAPTDGNPYPVVFKLVSNVYGPDGSALPLGEARIIAAAEGSLTDQRALFRLTSMNVRLPDGRRKVIDVDGWVVGEDGIRGMQGVLIDPIGKVIGAAGMTGAVAGIGEGLSASQLETTHDYSGNTNTVIAGNTGTYALGLGVSGAANQWNSIVRDRAKMLVPHVQVLSGSEATAVFAKSVSIPDLIEAMDSEESANSSLD